jgi:ABC-type multidrug transport system permease subunit
MRLAIFLGATVIAKAINPEITIFPGMSVNTFIGFLCFLFLLDVKD